MPRRSGSRDGRGAGGRVLRPTRGRRRRPRRAPAASSRGARTRLRPLVYRSRAHCHLFTVSRAHSVSAVVRAKDGRVETSWCAVALLVAVAVVLVACAGAEHTEIG